MKKIEAIIREEKLEDVTDSLTALGYPGVTISRVKGHGKQKGVTEQFRGRKYRIDFLTKLKLEIVAEEERVEDIVETIVSQAKTGEVGDGKIFVSPVEEATRIRTFERGSKAL